MPLVIAHDGGSFDFAAARTLGAYSPQTPCGSVVSPRKQRAACRRSAMGSAVAYFWRAEQAHFSRAPQPGCDEGDDEPRAELAGQPVSGPQNSHDRTEPTPYQRALAEVSVRRGSATRGHRRVRLQSVGDLMARTLPGVLWLVEGLLSAQGLSICSGEPKGAKTWAALELALAIATAAPAFGEFQVREARPVALFLLEEDERAVRSLLAAATAARSYTSTSWR